eukprot:12646700-Alexandrium_andersonii.AAC.1
MATTSSTRSSGSRRRSPIRQLSRPGALRCAIARMADRAMPVAQGRRAGKGGCLLYTSPSPRD